MIIGFDAKRAFNNFTGLGNYSRTLIRTLATYYPDNQYHLFTPKLTDHPRVNFLKNHPSVSTHVPTGLMTSLSPLWRSYFIKEDISKHKIDVFHGLSHELPLKLPKNVKSVVTIHDLIHEHYPQFYSFIDAKIYSWKFKNACEKADVVVAISEATKRDIIDFYKIDEQKIKVIYQSCDPQFKTPLSTETKKGDNSNLPELYVLYVGTVNERKNLLSLVKAMQLLDNQLNIKLVVVGDGGKYFETVKKYASDNQMQSEVIFLSNVPFTDFPKLYQNAQAFVLPSFQEGFGIPIIEALWSKCPVITSEGSCFPEAGGPDSVYINPADPQAIARAIELVVTNQPLRERMILRGYEYVQKFDDKNIGAAWIQLYESLYNS